MEELDPGRGWRSGGARFIKAKNGGDFSMKSLNLML